MVQYAEKEKGCPYYASRKAIPYLKLVLLPYNLILNKKSREALGIDLKVIRIIGVVKSAEPSGYFR